jgi:hypothetical protein
MFGSVPAAQAATDGSDIGAYPVAGTTFAGALVSDFPVYTQLKPGSSTTLFTGAYVSYKIEKTAGLTMDIMMSTSAVSLMAATASSQITISTSNILASTTATTASFPAVVANNIAALNFKAHSSSPLASWSPVTLKVTAFIDNQGGSRNFIVDSDELFTTFDVTLGTVTGAVTLTQPLRGDTTVKVSSTITGANLSNIKGTFFLGMSSSGSIYAGPTTILVNAAQSGSAVALKGGVLSSSITVGSISASQLVSAALRYVPTTGAPSAGAIFDGYLLGEVVSLSATVPAISALNATVMKSDNSTASSTAVPVRANQTYTVRVHALTASVSVSGTVVSVSLSGEALAAGSKMISINGGAATSSYPSALAVTTGADGYGSFTIATSGFAASNVVRVDASSANVLAPQLTLTATATAYFIANDYDLYATTPGTAINIGYTVVDQWQVAQSTGEYRLQLTKSGTGFSYATTVSEVAVVGGAATFAFTPTPVTKTGSAVVSATLQKYDASLAAWISGGSSDGNVTVTVTSTADSMSVSPAASTSVSVSYFPSTASYVTITGKAKNAGSSVVVSGDASSLVFRASSAVSATTSGAVTVRAAANGDWTFQVASLRAGAFTLSYGIGATSTTSQLIVDPAGDGSGMAISFDTTAIAAGSTATVTGTLVDANGNPVNTSGSATIVVTYKGSAGGAGIPIGVMPTETDKNGEFSFTVLAGATDKGTATVTAVYLKSGAATTVANTLTVVTTINVGGAAASADQKVTIGTFTGFTAVFVKGYEGKKLSVKLAGKWSVVPSIVDGSAGYYLFKQKTGAGYVANVVVYIDGVEVERMTVTTK